MFFNEESNKEINYYFSFEGKSKSLDVHYIVLFANRNEPSRPSRNPTIAS